MKKKQSPLFAATHSNIATGLQISAADLKGKLLYIFYHSLNCNTGIAIHIVVRKTQRPILLAPGYSQTGSWNLLWLVFGTCSWLPQGCYCCLTLIMVTTWSRLFIILATTNYLINFNPKCWSLFLQAIMCAPNKRANLITHCSYMSCNLSHPDLQIPIYMGVLPQ